MVEKEVHTVYSQLLHDQLLIMSYDMKNFSCFYP